MRKYIFFTSILFFIFSCSKKEYDQNLVEAALKNHSFYHISDEDLKKIASKGIKEIQKIDKNADFIYKEGKIKNEEKSFIKYGPKKFFPAIFILDKEFKVAKIFENSILYKSDFKKDSQIISINGKKNEELDASTLKELAEKSQKLDIEYKNSDKISKIEMKREISSLPFVWDIKISPKTSYVKIISFLKPVSKNLKNILSSLKEGDNLIIDLRNLSGGDFTEAATIANLFINKGENLFSLKSDKEGYNKTFIAENDKAINKINIFILTNSNTSLLAEILAAVLKEKLDAKIIGEKTAGKLYITKIFRAGKNIGLRLTVSKLYPPSGKEINEPLMPDFEITDKSEKNEFINVPFLLNQDEILMKAIELCEKHKS
jgi:C-terminal peptidase prc